MRTVPGFVRATESSCPLAVPADQQPKLIGWYVASSDDDDSVVFTTESIIVYRTNGAPEALRWEDISGFEAPWRDKLAYRKHRSLSIQSAAGWFRIRMGMTEGTYPHVDPLAQILHSLYPIVS